MKKKLLSMFCVLAHISQATTVKNNTNYKIFIACHNGNGSWKGHTVHKKELEPGQQALVESTDSCKILSELYFDGSTEGTWYPFRNLTKDSIIDFNFEKSTISGGGFLAEMDFTEENAQMAKFYRLQIPQLEEELRRLTIELLRVKTELARIDPSYKESVAPIVASNVAAVEVACRARKSEREHVKKKRNPRVVRYRRTKECRN